jgi:hypothetical protein
MATDDPPAKPTDAGGRASPIAIFVATLVWAVSTFGHGTGLKLAYAFFQWAQEPGALHPEGGRLGMQRAELLLGGLAAAVAVVVVAQVVRLLVALRPGGAVLLRAAVPWLLWATLVVVIRETFIVYATEFAHFVQYAIVAFLMAHALGGRRPQLAFLITCGLGFADELYQHYILHDILMGDLTHWMDWSDPVLDALGAAGGVLPFTTLLQVRAEVSGEPPPDTWPLARRALLVSAVAFVPLLLLNDVQVSRVLGHYRHHPFWNEYANDKPVHWPSSQEGIPLCLAGLAVIATLVEPRRRGLSLEGLLGVAVLLVVVVDPPSRREGRPVHEVVPAAQVRKAAAAPVIDGLLDDAVWQGATRVGPFVHTLDGARARVDVVDGQRRETSLRETTARLAWDDRALYLAFEVADPDPWALDRPDDHPDLLGLSEGVGFTLDDGGDEVTYCAVGVTPQGRRWDRFCLIPEAPVDYNPWTPYLPLPNWDARGLEVAVRVDGAPRVLTDPMAVTTPDDPPATGYVVEVAFPWENFRTDTTPTDLNYFHLPPRPGDRWRLNLFRVERARPTAQEVGDPASTLDAAGAESLIGCGPDRFAKLLEDKALVPGADGRFARSAVLARWADHRHELQAWSPVFLSTIHKPALFGVLQLVE